MTADIKPTFIRSIRITRVLLLFLCAICHAPAGTFAQVNPHQKDTVAIHYSGTITAAGLQQHLSVLSSDEYEGRETGQKGQKRAAEYIAAQFKNAGIPPYKDSVYYQTYPIIISTPQGAEITVNKREFELRKDFYHSQAGKQQNINCSKIVFLGYGISDRNYDDYNGVNVKGKAVLIIDGEPMGADSISFITGEKELSEWTTDHRKKREMAISKGVSLLIVVDFNFGETIAQRENFFTLPSMKILKDKEEKNDMPILYISENMAKEILVKGNTDASSLKKKIKAGKKPASFMTKAKISIKFKTKEEQISAENVIGFVEGGDLKNEYVFVTAHYDHLGIREGKIFNGADDNGSGTAAVIEMAEAFAIAKKQGHGPRRSMVFMTVSGEEKGLLGSKYYTSHPVFPLEQTVCDLNIDMIGRVDGKHKDSANYIYIIGSNFISTELHNINEISNKKYTHLRLDYTYNDTNDKNRFYYRSDHYNFAKNNVPVIFYFNGTHEDYHKETDEIGKIKFDIMETRARLVFFTAWEAANRPMQIKKDAKMESHK